MDKSVKSISDHLIPIILSLGIDGLSAYQKLLSNLIDIQS